MIDSGCAAMAPPRAISLSVANQQGQSMAVTPNAPSPCTAMVPIQPGVPPPPPQLNAAVSMQSVLLPATPKVMCLVPIAGHFSSVFFCVVLWLHKVSFESKKMMNYLLIQKNWQPRQTGLN